MNGCSVELFFFVFVCLFFYGELNLLVFFVLRLLADLVKVLKHVILAILRDSLELKVLASGNLLFSLLHPSIELLCILHGV